jgi:hypothetical protein
LLRIVAFRRVPREKTSHLPTAVGHPGVFFFKNKSLSVPGGFSVTAKVEMERACFLIERKRNLITGERNPINNNIVSVHFVSDAPGTA